MASRRHPAIAHGGTTDHSNAAGPPIRRTPASHARAAARASALAGSPEGPPVVDADARRRLIETAAYLRAERRGFVGGSAEADWLEAEAEVDAWLSGGVPAAKAAS